MRTNNSVLHTLSHIWVSFHSIFCHIARYIPSNESKKLFQILSQIKAKQFLEVHFRDYLGLNVHQT